MMTRQFINRFYYKHDKPNNYAASLKPPNIAIK